MKTKGVLAEESKLRTELEAKYGKVWTTKEMQEEFKVIGFGYGLCAVSRKSDGAEGSLDFTHAPRFYYNFVS
jgi:hypothetical protein